MWLLCQHFIRKSTKKFPKKSLHLERSIMFYAGNLHRKFVAPWCIRYKTKLQTVIGRSKSKQICSMKKLVKVNHVCVSGDDVMLRIFTNNCFWIGAIFFGYRAKSVMLVIQSTTVQNKVQTLCFSRNILHLCNCKVVSCFRMFSSYYGCVFEPKNGLVQRIFGANYTAKLQRLKLSKKVVVFSTCFLRNSMIFSVK